MGIQNGEPGQSGYAKSFETSSTRRRAAGLAALAFAGVAAGGCSSSTPANGNGNDAGYVAPPTGDDGSTSTDEASTDDGNTTTPTDDGSTTVIGDEVSPTGDGSMTGDGGTSTTVSYDGGIGPTCIKALYSTYVLRTDGVLIWENQPSSPETIVDSSTGSPLAGIVSVQEGQYHGCAAVSGGAKCWQTNTGNGNSSGQLGNGTTTSSSTLYRATPVLTAAATPLTNVVAVATGNASSNACAVTSDGKLWCWGDLTWLVSNGTTTLHTGYAQAITTDGTTPFAGVSSAVVGMSEACVLVSGSPNSVWCWGGNGSGQLGQGDTSTRQYPTKVLGLTAPTKLMSAGGYGDTVCALDGSNVRCWGNNQAGTVGSNTTTNPILSPTAVVLQSGTLLDGVDLQAGNGAFAVLRTGGTLWTWGYGFQNYAANYNVTNILAIGWAGPSANNGPRYITSDGIYHSAMTNVTVNCNAM